MVREDHPTSSPLASGFLQSNLTFMEPMRELTFGEKAVGLTFNPGNDPIVWEIKELYAQIIDVCIEEQSKAFRSEGEPAVPTEKSHLFSEAIRATQGAQMWAVKAATWKD